MQLCTNLPVELASLFGLGTFRFKPTWLCFEDLTHAVAGLVLEMICALSLTIHRLRSVASTVINSVLYSVYYRLKISGLYMV